ncbi:MAG: hypothetical protein ACE5LU_23455 [Anaerolineae bacterium]
MLSSFLTARQLFRVSSKETRFFAELTKFHEASRRTRRAWNGLGSALSRLERHQPALDAFRQAADLAQAKDARAMYLRNCASACLNLGWLDQVEAFLAQAAALDADHPYLHLRHAHLHLAREEPDAAIARCRRALERDQHLTEVHFTLGLALLCVGQEETAEEAYNSGLELAGEWGELEDACRALEKQMGARGDLAGAEEILSRLRAAQDELVAQWPAP